MENNLGHLGGQTSVDVGDPQISDYFRNGILAIVAAGALGTCNLKPPPASSAPGRREVNLEVIIPSLRDPDHSIIIPNTCPEEFIPTVTKTETLDPGFVVSSPQIRVTVHCEEQPKDVDTSSSITASPLPHHTP